ncbi:MAG: hypothetical protein CL828_03130 [Crocinitomicaceae bacterium]|nr:hypothetical protein [Crocinitomicaceae bacterium]|tara:strand:+ start:18763 stop:19206 length:444 start_codon:yes stop_codon:yes gene_type:complete
MIKVRASKGLPTITMENLPKKKRGRPKKSELSLNKAGNRGQIGRPKGDTAIINEYKSRMLSSPKSRKVLDSIMDAALDNEHKNQAAAWKLLMDRMLPISYFEKDKTTGGRSNISITISGLGVNETSNVEDSLNLEESVIEGTYTNNV